MICVRYQSRLEFPPSPDPLSHAFGRRRRPPRFQRERRRMFLLRACLCELGLGLPAVRFPARGPLRWGNGGRRPNRPTDRPTHPGWARRGEGEKNGSPLLHPFSIPPPTRLQMCYVCPFSTFSSPSLPLAMPLSIIEDCTGFSKRGIAFEREMWMYSFKQTFFPKLLIFDISSAC